MIAYDGDGNRVAETVGGITTNYLVDTQNPTGYAQVVDELQNGTVTKTYAYGLERISQNWQLGTGNWQLNFYGYDGHGSVRQLTNSTGVVTDTYDYDAFGDLINQMGSTPNNYLFAGEQYDAALGLYYNRARYLNTSTGRFWSLDTDSGDPEVPRSLHKYLYVSNDPVNGIDPSGNEEATEVGQVGAAAVDAVIERIEWSIELTKPIALWRRAAAALTAIALIASSIAASMSGGGATDLTNPGGNADHPITLYRDVDRSSPSDWRIDTPAEYDRISKQRIDGNEISLSEAASNNKPYKVPLQALYHGDKTPYLTTGAIVDEALADLKLAVRYTPTALNPLHWSLIVPFDDPVEQQSLKNRLAAFGKQFKLPTAP